MALESGPYDPLIVYNNDRWEVCLPFSVRGEKVFLSCDSFAARDLAHKLIELADALDSGNHLKWRSSNLDV